MKTFISILMIVGLFLYGYLVVLLGRTDFAMNNTSVGKDVIIYMYILCTLLLVGGIYTYIKLNPNNLLAITLLILSFLPLASFSYLNLSGKVAFYTKEQSTSE